MFLRDGGGVGLNVEVWRLLSKYAFLFSKKEGRGGALPLPIPPVQCCCYSFKSCFKTMDIAWGRGGQQK